MTVYYFQRPLDAAVKIGFTDRPIPQRRREIETSLGLELDLVGSEPGPRALERARHEQFAHLRFGGEWFRPGDDLHAFLRTLPGSRITLHPQWQDFHDNLTNELYELFRDVGAPIRYHLLAEMFRKAAGEAA